MAHYQLVSDILYAKKTQKFSGMTESEFLWCGFSGNLLEHKFRIPRLILQSYSKIGDGTYQNSGENWEKIEIWPFFEGQN